MEEKLLMEMYPQRKSIMATYTRLEVVKLMAEYSIRQKILMIDGFLEMIGEVDLKTKQQFIDLVNTEKNYINGGQ